MPWHYTCVISYGVESAFRRHKIHELAYSLYKAMQERRAGICRCRRRLRTPGLPRTFSNDVRLVSKRQKENSSLPHAVPAACSPRTLCLMIIPFHVIYYTFIEWGIHMYDVYVTTPNLHACMGQARQWHGSACGTEYIPPVSSQWAVINTSFLKAHLISPGNHHAPMPPPSPHQFPAFLGSEACPIMGPIL